MHKKIIFFEIQTTPWVLLITLPLIAVFVYGLWDGLTFSWDSLGPFVLLLVPSTVMWLLSWTFTIVGEKGVRIIYTEKHLEVRHFKFSEIAAVNLRHDLALVKWKKYEGVNHVYIVRHGKKGVQLNFKNGYSIVIASRRAEKLIAVLEEQVTKPPI
ncbi:MAG: hypothetical protein ACRCYY_01325 [Trueperaceae bacterium]